MPGTLGMGLVEGYDAVNLPLAYPELRAELERDLKAICEGRRDPPTVLAEQVTKYEEAYKVITEKIRDMDRALGNRFDETPQDPPPPPPGGMAMIEETFKCPKCDQFKMSLRTKKDNAGFFIGCLGHPNCKNVIWLPSMIKEIKVDPAVCTSCGSKKFTIKFKTMSTMSLLDPSKAVDNVYNSCLVCDSNLRSVLDVAEDTVKKVARSTTTTTRPLAPSNSTSSNTRSNFPSSSTSAVRSQTSNISNATTAPSRAPARSVGNRNGAVTANVTGGNPPPAAPRTWGNSTAGTSNSWGSGGGSSWSSNNNNTNNDQDVKCPACGEVARK